LEAKMKKEKGISNVLMVAAALYMIDYLKIGVKCPLCDDKKVIHSIFRGWYKCPKCNGG